MDRRQPLEKEKVESQHNELYEIGEKQENRVRHLETSLMLLVFAYVLFQGVIFVSIFQHPNVSCRYWWIPFSLSCLIFVLFAIPFKFYVRNWDITKYYHEMNFLQQDLLHQRITISSSHETNRYDHPQEQQLQWPVQSPSQLLVSQLLVQLSEQSQSAGPSAAPPSPVQAKEILKSDTARANRRKAFIYLVSSALVAYTILILKACQSIPCHRDATP